MAKGWPAARLRLRSEVRTTRAGLALLVAVLALSAGVAMAAFAGARRSDSAYGRFLTWSKSYDLTASGCDDVAKRTATTRVECTDEQAAEALARVRELPFVESSAEFGFIAMSTELPNGTRPSFLAFSPAIDADARIFRDANRVKMVDGRLPDPAAVDEVAIGKFPAERFHLSVGEVMRGLAFGPKGLSDVGPLRIVGIYVAPGELPSATGAGGGSLLLTRAFGRAHEDLVERKNSGLALRLRPGTSEETAEAAIRAIGFDVNNPANVTSGIERTIRVETIALLLLGIIVAGVGLVVVGQMLRRQTTAELGADGTFWALGCDRSDALRLALLRGLLVGAAGAALAVGVAVAMSPLFPVGVGRVADPDIGIHADGEVLAFGALLTLLLAVVVAVLAAAHSTWADRRQAARTPNTPWPLPARRPSVLVGLYLARPTRSRTSTAWASLLSVVVVIVIVAATAVTLASFDHLVRRRDLAGATWHAAFQVEAAPDGTVDLPGQVAAARAVPGVEAATFGTWATTGSGVAAGLYVNGQLVGTQIFGDEGPIQPAIERGRAPERAGEVALGRKTLASLGLRLGDAVHLSVDPSVPPQTGRVVGETVLVSPYFYDFAPGIGAATVWSTFSDLGIEPTYGVILVRYAAGADSLRTFNAVEETLQTPGFEAADRQQVSGLSRIRLVPTLLLGGLLVLVAAAIAHVLLVSVTGHRRDVAVLRALGFTRPQSWTSVTVQAGVISLVACAIGIPLGVLFGRAAWQRIAANFYVVPRPMAPLALLGVISAVMVGVAVVASLVPSAKAVRLKPAAVLRTD
jgi:ABC-type lipoprotein release transport system permease subunit